MENEDVFILRQDDGGSTGANGVVTPSAADIVRDISGETVCGFRVAAYRETHPEHGDKYGHTYSEHWSTPSRNPAVTVERLFTEEQLRGALSRLSHGDLCRLSVVFGRGSDLRTDQDIRINEWLKVQLASLAASSGDSPIANADASPSPATSSQRTSDNG